MQSGGRRGGYGGTTEELGINKPANQREGGSAE